MKTKFKIEGLDCANCALELQEEIEKLEDIKYATVDYVNQQVFVEYTKEDTLDKVKDVCNHFEEVKVVNSSNCKLNIEGLDCASCALELQEEIEKIDGVSEVHIDFATQQVFFSYEKNYQIDKVKDVCNHFEEVKVIEDKKTEKFSHKKEWILLAVSLLFYIPAIILNFVYDLDFTDFTFQNNVAPWIISFTFFILSYLVIGHPILIKMVKNLAHGKVFDENFLMSIASIGAMLIGEMVEGAAVMILYQFGELLQSIAVESSRKSISNLMDLKSDTATILKGDEQVVVAPEELKIDDILVIKNGEKVPVDAVISQGESSFDLKSLTGEALPQEKKVGDELLSGSLNIGAVVQAKVTREYHDSTVAKILDLVENSTAKKASSEKFITRFAKVYTPIVCAIAFIVGIIVPFILSLTNQAWGANFLSWIYKALILLVISCPCAVVISVPLTYFGGIGACARRGILLKGTTYLDELTEVVTVAFDKTGTLTKGVFSIVHVESKDQEELLKIVAAAEKGSNHPIAKAFEDIETPYVASEIKECSGKGIQATIENNVIYVGNAALLKEHQVEFTEINSISTVLYVAKNQEYLGYIEIDDAIKEDASILIEKLKASGIKKCVMLTGDQPLRAKKVGEELKLDEIYGGLLPDQKLEKVEELKKQGKLLYLGDGINDAPVLIAADVGASMGKIGSDAAIEASDMVLLEDELIKVVDATLLAKKTKRIAYENIIFSIFCKVLFMVLGILNLIPLWVAVFADVGVMLIAVFNAFRMRMKLSRGNK